MRVGGELEGTTDVSNTFLLTWYGIHMRLRVGSSRFKFLNCRVKFHLDDLYYFSIFVKIIFIKYIEILFTQFTYLYTNFMKKFFDMT